MTTAVSPGSFDPLTVGHIDIIERARTLFDQVIVAIAVNSAKTPLLTIQDRLEIARQALAHLDGVRVEPVSGLLVDFCTEVGATALVKGIRGGADFDTELPMALMNRHLTGVETVFIPGNPELAHIASSLVKDVARHGGQIEDMVPAGVAQRVRQAITKGNQSTTGAPGPEAKGR